LNDRFFELYDIYEYHIIRIIFMSTLIYFLIFIFVLFLYIHITAHYKKSEDLEIYEADYTNAKQLQEICELKQPVLFDISQICPSELVQPPNLEEIEKSAEKSSYEIHIKDTTDIRNQPDIAGDSILLPFRSGYGLIQNDQKSRFFSENNNEFAEDVIPNMREMDKFLKPSFVAQTKYDLLFGSDKSYTACRYHTEYEKFLLVKTGKIQVKMTPWKSRKYLYLEADYTNYEFRSPIDIWNPQEQYKKDVENIKFLEFEVIGGFILYVPPFWFYSIQFINGDASSPAIVESYTYNSVMNISANLPQWGMYYLQQSNTRTKVLAKKGATTEADSEVSDAEAATDANDASDSTNK